MLNLATLLEDSARKYPARNAVILNDTKLTYGQLNAMSNMIASGLVKAGIEPGDKVALGCPNLPFFPIVYYGILKAGATVVPLNVLLRPREIAYHLDDSDAKAYFCFEGTADLPMGQMGHAGFQEAERCETMVVMTADPAAASPIEGVPTMGQFMHGNAPTFDTINTSPSDTAVILYTSGTTGRPKGAELSHSNMVMNAFVAANLFGLEDGQTHLITLPLFHSFGQTCQMNAGLYTGSTLSLLPRFDPAAALGIMQRDNVNVFCGVPTMYWAMLNLPGAEDKFDLEKIAENLILCGSGGSAMPVEVMKDFEEKFKVPILEGYGLSETSPVATFSPLDGIRKPGSVGIPIWGVEIRIVNEMDEDVPQGELGEILIKGHNIMKGYYGRPEATAETMRGGWFHSGDIGRFDEDGYVYIVDRVKDMIIRGGYNVYPRELEEVLMEHPAVSLAAVIGVPDDQYGEEVKAYIIPRADATATADEIKAWCKENMAPYKYPRMIVLRDELPMTATGKILKRELRDER